MFKNGKKPESSSALTTSSQEKGSLVSNPNTRLIKGPSPVDPAYYKNRDLSHPRASEDLSIKGDSSSMNSDSDDFLPDDDRESWTGKLDFLLSCIGFAVGLGNIWRFPFLCYKSGGGAFLFPYMTFLGVCGLPLFFLETSYGQFSSLSPITVWRICPLFKGIGYGMVLISGIVCVYYNIIITWTFYYLFASMQEVLPWSHCNNPWNGHLCTDNTGGKPTNTSLSGGLNAYTGSLAIPLKLRTASEEFWEFNVLERSDGIEYFGSLRLPLLGCLLLAWFLVFCCLCKGVKSSGKVVYVTATFPYLVLSILLVRGMSLPGAMAGIRWYIVPQWEKLATLKVWGDAATQIFFSVGMAWGSLITLASYNKFSNNVFRDAMIVPCINCFTSVFAGLVIFSVLGFMSHSTGIPIEKVVTQGPGLIFVVYPEAVAKMPFSHVWAILFFLMIFTIGLDSQFGMFETMTSAFIDEYPHILRRRKVLFTAFMCCVEFCMGLPMVYQGGFYLLTLMDWYSSCFSLMLLSLIECLIISWVYGVDRFIKDIELMIGYKPSAYWKYMWKFVTPGIVVFIWTFSLNDLKRASLGNYQYPDWSIVIGWGFGFLSVIPLPICALYALSKEKHGNIFQKMLKLLQPAVNFGPAKTEDRERYYATFNDFDWLRYNAVKAGRDWRTYKRMNGKKNINVTNSNIVDLDTSFHGIPDINVNNIKSIQNKFKFFSGSTTYIDLEKKLNQLDLVYGPVNNSHVVDNSVRSSAFVSGNILSSGPSYDDSFLGKETLCREGLKYSVLQLNKFCNEDLSDKIYQNNELSAIVIDDETKVMRSKKETLYIPEETNIEFRSEYNYEETAV